MKIKNLDTALTRKFVMYFVPYLYSEFLLLVLMLLGTAGSLVTPYVLKIIIDDIFPKGNLRALIQILIFLLVVYILRIACSVIIDILNTSISQKIVADIRSDILSVTLKRDTGYFKTINHGELIYTVMNDVHVIQNALSSLLTDLLNNALNVLGILIMLGVLNLKLTLMSLTVIPVIMVSIRKFTPFIQRSFRNIQETEEHLNGFFMEKLRNIRVIKSFNTLAYEEGRLHSISNKLITNYRKNAKISSLNSNITTFLIAIGPIIVLIYGGIGVFAGTMTVGALIAFIQYLNRLYSPSISIMNNYNQLLKSVISMERVGKYLDLEDTEQDRGKKEEIKDFRKIIFDDVTLIRDNTTILEGVSLNFERGKLYGVLGPSGSGKSSFVNLLCGFIQPSSGSVSIDAGKAINMVSNWSCFLGLIEKENQLFNGTIYENIKYGNFGATDSAIDVASRLACFLPVVDKLPQGYETVINETGTMLSDGQKQRISIARALLKSPSIIIFDESTSTLDLELENRLIANIKLTYEDAIIIIITHRYNILKQVDHIYAFEDGRLKKEGSLEDFHLELSLL